MIKQAYVMATLVCITLSLGACSNDKQNSKLQQQLADIRSRPSGQVEPLPERALVEAPLYTGNTLRNPFSLHGDTAVAVRSTQQNRPDDNRVKSPLEQQPLETLSLVGTLKFADEKSATALIDDGQGKIHKVTVGQYLGQDFGKVAEIKEDTVFIEETVQDELGGWIKRPRQLKLAVITDD